jgi:NAD(P)-dependent dehydrogenase (short-subunit alcohol dehydrogenase family)
VENKVLLITGIISDITSIYLKNFAKLKYNIAIIHNKQEKQANKIINELKEYDIETLAVDSSFTDNISAKETVKKIVDKFNNIDILINDVSNIEYIYNNKNNDLDWNKIIDTDLKIIYNFSKFVLQKMINKRFGRIINLTSFVGTKPIADISSIFAATNAGILGFSRSLAKEVASYGITVNCVSHGITESTLLENLTDENRKKILNKIPMKRFAKPEEITDILIFLASNKTNYITGQNIIIDGGLTI